jgi:hypothetical protein
MAFSKPGDPEHWPVRENKWIVVDEVYETTDDQWKHVARVIGGIDSKNAIVVVTNATPDGSWTEVSDE